MVEHRTVTVGELRQYIADEGEGPWSREVVTDLDMFAPVGTRIAQGRLGVNSGRGFYDESGLRRMGRKGSR